MWRVGDVEADLHLLDAAALRRAYVDAGLEVERVAGLLVGASAFGRDGLTRRLTGDFEGALAIERAAGRSAGPGRPRQAAAHRGASPTSSRALSTDQKTRSASLTLSSDDMGRASAWSCRTSVTGSDVPSAARLQGRRCSAGA